ncbi:MAG: hypothetical protein RLZZ65_623 [Bacteroidota bacterium]|jgi:hypothetical protein
MTDSKQYQALAEQTWPLFERKRQRIQRFKKIKKYSLWMAVLVLVGWFVFTRSKSAPVQEKNSSPRVKKERIVKKNVQLFKKGLVLQKESNLKLDHSNYIEIIKIKSPLFSNLEEKNNKDFAIQQLPIQRLNAVQNNLVPTLAGKCADLTLACAALHLNPMSFSLQANGHSLSAILDSKTLMIMNLMYGDDPLPKYPKSGISDTWYRPDFFPADQFVQVSFYDIAEWIQNPLTVKVLANRQDPTWNLDPRNTRSSSVNLATHPNEAYSPTFRNLHSTLYYSNKMLPSLLIEPGKLCKNVFVADRPAEAFNPLLFHRSDTLLVMSAQAERLTKLSMYGSLISSKEVVLKSKGIQSVKRKEMLLDEQRGELYIIAPTNFHFVFYKLNLQTGIAIQVYKTTTVWAGATFEIKNARLYYTFKNEEIEVELDSAQ